MIEASEEFKNFIFNEQKLFPFINRFTFNTFMQLVNERYGGFVRDGT